MDRPRPVPPYLRLVLPSACRKASKMVPGFSSGMPMPMSCTAMQMASLAAAMPSGSSSSGPGLEMERVTAPLSVNLKAFESRLRRICCSRCMSVNRLPGRFGPCSTLKATPLSAAMPLKTRCRSEIMEEMGISPRCSSTLPASTLERSRISLISLRRSAPEELMAEAASFWRAERLPSLLCARSWDRMRMELSGVRSS